ncbi:hypothetical protein [Actinophytocola sediminis]
MVSVESLRGYVLEEVLARLLYDNGYRLLVSEQQDPEALKRGAHGLLVRGRGADHQADVLGELTLPVPFSLPLRIFVEAKYRGVKANLRDVRNAHGVVHDVNEQYATASAGARSVPVRRYYYRYTLFSATGFSRPAQQYALAQQISLVDLSSPAFTALLDAANRTAYELHGLADEVRVSPFPRGQVRTALRVALGTWTADGRQGNAVEPEVQTSDHRAWHTAEPNSSRREPQQLPVEPLARIAATLVDRASGDLLLGFPSAPFVLPLRPNDPAALPAYVARYGPDVRVNIEFATRREVTGDWVIVPADGSRSFQFQFALPALLEDWLLRDDGAAALRARDVKADLLSSIAVFQDGRLVRLLFQPRRRA